MLRHGRLRFATTQFETWLRLRKIGVCLLVMTAAHLLIGNPLPTGLVSSTLNAQTTEVAVSGEMRMRLSWGGGAEPRTWFGKIEVVDGKVEGLVPLGLMVNASASAKQINDNVIEIAEWDPTNYGGVDFTLSGERARLRIEFRCNEEPDRVFQQEWTNDQLQSGVHGGELDANGNRCSLTRAPGDQVRFQSKRGHLVFQPGEMFEFQISPNRTGFTTRQAALRARLRSRTQPDRALFTKSLSFDLDREGSSHAQPVEFKVPAVEGVYNLELTLEPNWYQSSFNVSKKYFKRTIQFIVLGTEPVVAPSGDSEWRLEDSIELVQRNTSGFAAWPNLSNQAWSQKPETLGNNLHELVERNDRELVKLLPGGWLAVPLKIDRPGRPHVLELDFLKQRGVALGLSILEADSQGQVSSYGFDSGLRVDEEIPEEQQASLSQHAFSFWPRTSKPYLLIANRGEQEPAVLGKLNLFAGPQRLNSRIPSSVRPETNRKLMAFYEAPLFAENFNASEYNDPVMGEPLDDWQKFYDGADRLIQYLKANSFQGAFVTVACEGSTIYPSELLRPTPRHDSGVFFSTGQDPIRKDVLEMLFRMFEREQLTLVPMVSFTSPLGEIESNQLDPARQGVELLDLNRRPVGARAKGLLPIYNPLCPQVQRATRRVVEELAVRYQPHRSFAGVAISCRPDTFTMLPGRNWAYDSATVNRFIQSQTEPYSIPADIPSLHRLLLQDAREAWIEWRANQMSRWYESMAVDLKRHLPGGKLYLAPLDLYRNEEMVSVLSPSLHNASDFPTAMKHLGFQPRIIEGKTKDGEESGIVMLNPHRMSLDQSFASRRIEQSADDSPQVMAYFKRGHHVADLFHQRTEWAHFEQLQSEIPFGKQLAPLMRLQPQLPTGDQSRRRFAENLKRFDTRMLIDGGWTLNMGQESELVEFAEAYSHLPDEPFKDVTTQRFPQVGSLPIAVRQHQGENESHFYVVNSSPWATTVSIWLDVASASETNIVSLNRSVFQVKPLVSMASASNSGLRNRRIHLSVNVPPYSLVAARSDDPDSNIVDFDFSLPEGVDQQLRKQVYVLQSKLVASGKVPAIPAIQNPEFEEGAQRSLRGWEMGDAMEGVIQAVAANTQNSERRNHLQIKSEDRSPVWIRSNTFQAPKTGRLSISVWLKTDDPDQQPPLRLSLEGKTPTSSYYRFGSVGSLSPDPRSNQLGSEWKRFAVHFDDLPVQEMTQVRVGFDLMGPGQVSIDGVEVYDRWFDKNDAKAINQMLASTGPLLSNKATFDQCRRLLESYWLKFLNTHIEDSISEVDESSVPQADTNFSRSASSENIESWESESKAKLPMFRRFRNLVPQRKSSKR